MKENLQKGELKKKYRNRYRYARGLYNQFTDGALHSIWTIIRMAQKEIRILRAFIKGGVKRK